MRIGINFSVILLLISSIVDAQEIFTPPVKPNNAFKAGENLTYQLRYGIIVGGIATLSLTKESYDSKTVFYARAVAQTTGLADKLYGVRDIYESWFDPKTNMPYKQVRDINEGKYTKYNEVTYNRENNTVKSKLSGVHPVPPKILDLTSTFYYLRRVDYSKVKDGDVLFVNMYFGDEIFPFRLVFRGKETIRTKFGKMDCLKICPIVEVGRMFKRPDDLTIWLSDDDNRIPVSVEMDIRVVGKIHLKLMSYENTVNPLVFQQ
jgi:hypothetical protein